MSESSAESRAPSSAQGGTSVLSGALVTATATLFSRVLGFARDALMLALFGVHPALGSFHLAWVVPNLFRRLFGEGAVSAAVLPALARAENAGGHDATRRLYSRFQGVFLAGLTLVVLAGEAVVFAAHARAEPGAHRDFLVLTAYLLPYLLPICMAALAGAPQHLAGRFAFPALAPAALNLVWITALLFIHGRSGAERGLPELKLLCLAILVGGLGQWGMQWVVLRKIGFAVRPVFRKGDGTVRATLRSFAPALLGLAVVQLNLAVDQVLVRVMVDPSANTYTHIANRLLQLPLALVGISAATGMLPQLSRLAARGHYEELTRALRQGSEMTLLIILAAAAGLYVTAMPTVTVLFEHGRFTEANSLLQAEVLRAYLWGLPPAALAGLMTRARQARGDYRGPAWIAAAVVPVNLLLDVLLLPRLGTPGAGYATSAALGLQFVLLTLGLRRFEIGNPLSPARILRLALPAAVSTAGAAGLVAALGPFARTAPGLAAVVASGALLALGASAVLLPEEFRQVRRSLGRKRE